MEIQTKFQRYTFDPGHKSFNPRYNLGNNSFAALHAHWRCTEGLVRESVCISCSIWLFWPPSLAYGWCSKTTDWLVALRALTYDNSSYLLLVRQSQSRLTHECRRTGPTYLLGLARLQLTGMCRWVQTHCILRVLQRGGGGGHRSFREALHPPGTTVSMLRYETSFVFLLVKSGRTRIYDSQLSTEGSSSSSR